MTVLVILMAMALVGLVVWGLAQRSKDDEGINLSPDLVQGQYGSLTQSVQFRSSSPRSSQEVSVSYDTARENRVSIEEAGAWADVHERQRLGQQGYYRTADGSYAKVGSPARPAALEQPSPSRGLSGAREARTLLKRQPAAEVHFSGFTQEDRRSLAQDLGPQYIVSTIDYSKDGGAGSLTVLLHPQAGQNIGGIWAEGGEFTPDPFGSPDWLYDGRFNVRPVDMGDGKVRIFCEPQF